MPYARHTRVSVSVDEAGENGLSAKINFPAESGGKVQDFRIGADSENPATADGNRLSAGKLVVYGPDVAVIQNQFGFDAREREQSKGSETAEEIAPRSFAEKSRKTFVL